MTTDSPEIPQELLDLYAEEVFEYEDFDDSQVTEDDSDLPDGPPEDGWAYPYKPYPKQRTAHSYDVDELLFGGAAGPGKGHPLSVEAMRYDTDMGQPQDQDVKVLTPFGFKLFRDVRVGDQLTNPDGSVQRVLQVFELGERDIYRVTFSDGATTLVTDDHLWLVNYSGKRYKADRKHPIDGGWSGRTSGVVETTANLRTHLDTCHTAAAAGKRPNWPLIPLTEPVQFTTTARNPAALHPIKPYLLGVLIGDGALSGGVPRFHSADPAIAEFIREDGDVVRYYQEDRPGRTLEQGTYVVDGRPVREAMDRLGILTGALDKRVPEAYMRAPLDTRWKLAQGLFDSDGTASTGGDVTFTTISPGLAEDVQWLVRSLGFRAKITTKTPTYTHNGEKRAGQLAYTLHVQGDRTPDLFRLERKRERCSYGMNGGQRVKRRMVSIEHVGVGEARCIKVNHPNSLYITDDFIVTHNTDWCLAECVNTCLAVPGAKVLLLRNTYQELLEEIRPRLDMRIPEEVAKYSREEKAYKFFNGARLRLGYLERDDQKRRYQGAEYVLIAYDELTLMPWSAYTWLRSRVRATGPVAEALKAAGLRPRVIATTNPGGAFHVQVKQHFVDPAPAGKIYRDPVSKLTRVYIPATLDDNPAMPPEYRQMLMGLDPDKRKALLEGSWDVLEGVRFAQWDQTRHVVTPEEFPLPMLSGQRVMAVDYGWDDPFVCLWGIKLGSGLILIYRELYEKELTATQQAELIKEHTTDLEWQAGIHMVADPSMWGRRDASAPKSDGDIPSISSPAYDYMNVLGFAPKKARNDRLLGAYKYDDKLLIRPDGWPRLIVHDTCVNFVRSVPSLLRSKINPDDVSQHPKQDDHAYDAGRYLLFALDPADPTPKKEEARRPKAPMITAGIMDMRF